jgi:hypothetical protein
MHELLLLNPHAFGVALMNYAQLHLAYLILKMLYKNHFADARKDAIRQHFWSKHDTEIDDCTKGKCVTL